MDLFKVAGIAIAAVLFGMFVTWFLQSDIIRPVEFSAQTQFFYSGDQGKTYGNQTKEFDVGETVYMKVRIKVESNKRRVDEIGIQLIIPYITAVDAKYFGGTRVTPKLDEINNLTIYDFEVLATRDADEFEIEFQFIPNSSGTISMTLIYDDQVRSSYDKINTVQFND